MKELSEHLSPEAVENVTAWLGQPKYAEYKLELEQMIVDEKWQELEDSFFKEIEFGTSGRRGVVSIGSNRINRVTIGESTQALCKYAKSVDENTIKDGVIIACDTRLSSPELSEYVALVCAANGFKTYIFDSFRSTPELSFAIRYLKCAIGVVITASHNAPQYNGFKAYWRDGGQLVPPHDMGVLEAAKQIEHIDVLPDFDRAVEQGLITMVSEEVDNAYIAAVLHERMSNETDLKIAYSPLHGAGQRNALPVLEQAGFDVITVKDQMTPDGNFPTMEDGRANPEKKPANDRVVALMLAENADIAVSNDPDADRLGIMVRQNDQPVYLSGNQTAVLATEYVLQKLHQRGELTSKHYIVKTIVTTDMLSAIAKRYNITCIENLQVGFKWIAEAVHKREQSGDIFVTGSEESYGLMKGTYTRDKDGAVALILAEYAAELKKDNKTLYDQLLELFQEYGVYVEELNTLTCEGAKGFADMQKIMKSIREKPVIEIDGQSVTAVLDYSTLDRTEIVSGATSLIDAAKADVYVLELGDTRKRITIRPSGTEPILKFYVQWFDEDSKNGSAYEKLTHDIENMTRALEGVLIERLDR